MVRRLPTVTWSVMGGLGSEPRPAGDGAVPWSSLIPQPPASRQSAAWDKPQVSRQGHRDPGEPMGEEEEENWRASRLSALTQGLQRGVSLHCPPTEPQQGAPSVRVPALGSQSIPRQTC